MSKTGVESVKGRSSWGGAGNKRRWKKGWRESGELGKKKTETGVRRGVETSSGREARGELHGRCTKVTSRI